MTVGRDAPATGTLQAEVLDRVLRVTIDRPEKRNALSRAVLAELQEVFTAHAADEGLCLAVLRGAGDASFAAGGDLRDLSAVRTEADAARMAEEAKAALHAVRSFPVPVIAALNGDALGGGAELALACDLRVAAAHARIGFVQGRLNISTAWGGGVDLLRLVGTARGLRLLGRGEVLDARAARDAGLVDAVAALGEGLEAALQEFVAPFLVQTPRVLRAFKALAAAVRRGDGREALDALETRLFAATWAHEDHWAAAETLLARIGGSP